MSKIGIIDLGSNSARLVIVNMFADGHFMVVDELKESVRLGQDMDTDGFLKPQRVAETIKTLKMFKRLCDTQKVEKIIAVATAAVRQAKNQKSFLDEIQVVCGIKISVLSEEEEATLVYRGVINSMDIPKGLILEIGGGSTKIVNYNRRTLLNYAIIPYGALTATNLFFRDIPTLPEKPSASKLSPEEYEEKMAEYERVKKEVAEASAAASAQVEEYFKQNFKQIEWLKDVDPEARMIGVGGSFRNLYKINKMVRKYPLDVVHNYNFAVQDLNNIYDMVKVLDVSERKRIKGLSPSRADIMPAAMAIMKAFAEYVGAEEFTISGSGLREGIMFTNALPAVVDRPISDVLGYSLETLVRYYDCNIEHVTKVVNLSVVLFRQLRVLHKFPRQYLKILKIAASLHDCGMRIKYYSHPKHSTYMILNSTIYGATHREIVVAAFVAGCHKKEDINLAEWAKYKNIVTEEDFEAVKKLGVLLRIAESLDRSMSGVVKDINCDVLGDSVIMKTELAGDATLEIRDALTASGEFKRAFKKNLEVL